MLENNPFGFNILSLVVWFPTLGAVAILFGLKKTQENAIKWAANAIFLVSFLISLPLWTSFDNNGPQFQYKEVYEWIPTIGVQYHLGLDGISLLLVMMTTLLGFIACLSSWDAITDRVKQYYIFLLLLQTGMLGVFVSLDFFLFYVFWEVMLVPMYFLIGVWGGPRKLYAAIKFFLYTLVGSVLMLLGILALYFAYYQATGVYTFDITQLWTADYAPGLQFWVFVAFYIGFAIKVPMFPFHTWLPDAHVEAPTAGSVILAGVLLKMGTYGFVRFSLPLLPDASRDAVWWVLAFAVIGIIYGALVALVQPDWKKLVAYSSVSHLGIRDARDLRAHGARPPGRDPPDDQPRPFDRRPVPDRGDHVRADPHPGDLRLRRHREGGAGVRDALSRHRARLDGASAPERVHRGVHDPPGHVREPPRRLALRRVRGLGDRARSGVPALALPAAHVRQTRQAGEREAAGRHLARARDASSSGRPLRLDRGLSQAVSRSPPGSRSGHRGAYRAGRKIRGEADGAATGRDP